MRESGGGAGSAWVPGFAGTTDSGAAATAVGGAAGGAMTRGRRTAAQDAWSQVPARRRGGRSDRRCIARFRCDVRPGSPSLPPAPHRATRTTPRRAPPPRPRRARASVAACARDRCGDLRFGQQVGHLRAAAFGFGFAQRFEDQRHRAASVQLRAQAGAGVARGEREQCFGADHAVGGEPARLLEAAHRVAHRGVEHRRPK